MHQWYWQWHLLWHWGMSLDLCVKLFWDTTSCTVPSLTGSWYLSWWFTQCNRIQAALATVDILRCSGTYFKLLFYQLKLTCCSVRGKNSNILWTLYVWWMVVMLNVCNLQNKLWEILHRWWAKSLCFSYSFYSQVKLKHNFITSYILLSY